ncbi:sulfatase-like hydrolase/transferase [Paenibacillus agricola]|uniref:Sulfatase-like hydrolase/transferase n=1 Tax=Paenibacillus agricola TaxID=2716264 RepID=A0ABX0JDR5_9BACL|nr:sulfatase-like hydrolase/transferase [Paenibacillus agricola]NHN33708.1 sulfatase-like hydrolase/transferase [Paenibacillus agricola]
MKPPNILFIMLDQLRYDCIGFSGVYPVLTPNIDRLASEGVWFSNAFTPIPICGPSRQALINGRRPETFGALWNFKNGLGIPALEPTEYAWPRELNKLSYKKAFLGKWDVHPEWTPKEYGYDSYTGFDPYKKMIAQAYPDVRYEAGFFGERNPIPVEHSQTHWLANQACASIRELEDGDDPWYIQLNFTEPHLPCRPSEKFADMYRPEDIPVWGGFNETFTNKPYIQKQQLHNWQIQDYTWEEWAPIVARYYGMISQADDAIGQVLHMLEQTGAVDNTMVILTSDHGDMCGSHRMMDKHYILYDDVVKVPLIVKYPGMARQGQQCAKFVYNMLDLPPTLLELLQLPVPSFFHGKSLIPLLDHEPESVSDWRTEAISTYNGQQFGLYTQRMIRTSKWKYIWNTTDIDELYHLEQDPYELTNLIYDPSCTELIKEYRRLLYHRLLEEGDGLVQNEWMRNQLLQSNKL